jgi:hypothetical protein
MKRRCSMALKVKVSDLEQLIEQQKAEVIAEFKKSQKEFPGKVREAEAARKELNKLLADAVTEGLKKFRSTGEGVELTYRNSVYVTIPEIAGDKVRNASVPQVRKPDVKQHANVVAYFDKDLATLKLHAGEFITLSQRSDFSRYIR